jgi:hypothetical protein
MSMISHGLRDKPVATVFSGLSVLVNDDVEDIGEIIVLSGRHRRVRGGVRRLAGEAV